MVFTDIIFFVFSAVIIFASVQVIISRNPVYSALYLVLAFFSSSAIWLLLEAEFLAIALILVYVGAVMVLFLFVVMMLDINLVPLREGFARYLPVGITVSTIIVVEMGMVLFSRFEDVPEPIRHAEGYSNTEELGSVLYTVYVYPFEMAAVILLVAIIAAISLTLRRRPGTKHQDPAEQVAVKAKDRLRIVKMKAEPKR